MPLAGNGPTMDTTYALRLHYEANRVNEGGWHFESQAEYTSPDDITDLLVHMYGGAFADPAKHQIIEISRRPLSGASQS